MSPGEPSSGRRSDTRSFHLRVFGCQMNFYDGELIRGAFQRRGWAEADDPESADLVLFHTCSVREHAEERVHSLLGELKRVKRQRPELVVGVVGCMAEREGLELFEREPHVDIVCGSRHFPGLPDQVERVLGGEERVLELGDAAQAVDAPVRDLIGRPAGHMAQVAVMRGCDLHCSFCIVPSVRGRVESRPVAQVVDECRRLVDAGVTDITLLGQTIDAYGADLGPKGDRPKLGRLLDALAELDALERVRLITLHPSYCDQELADAMARSPQFLRLLPIPLQSGSDRILRAMKRGYTTELYRRRVDLLRERMPDLELVSDWIVGFPGESDEDFAASEAAMREFGFLQSFVFQYSPRPGTAAFDLADEVPPELKGARNRRLLELQHQIARERTPRLVGTDSVMMLERPFERDPGLWMGRVRNGHYALLPHRPGYEAGRAVSVRLGGWNGRELLAEDRPTPGQLAALAVRAAELALERATVEGPPPPAPAPGLALPLFTPSAGAAPGDRP
ncbi:MAG: MiaB/RimO family radical SAM methylthiotransferase [Planctomycetes bacterium]|nr:MiaB/RimO family radical SAM methylthiotransferase [Planctomycetota bacterium]MBL7008481.1 MiaB/RimO family radical SAM methylthiotransferase [Planctomycetota bacterium]